MTRPADTRCPTDEPLDTLVFRPLAALLVQRLAPTRVTPNQVSLAGALAGIGAAACLVEGGLVSALGAPVLLLVSLVLDVTDGQLARLRSERTHAGWVMDILSDGLKGIAVFAAVAVALARAHGPVGLAWGAAAGVSVLVQVLLRDHALHRYERARAPSLEGPAVRDARIHAERRRLRAGPPTLARMAMAAYDLALALASATPFARIGRADPRPDGADPEQRLAAQRVWRHLGGTAQLVVVAAGAALGRLLPAAMMLVMVGNAVLATAAVLERRADGPRLKTAELRRKSA